MLVVEGREDQWIRSRFPVADLDGTGARGKHGLISKIRILVSGSRVFEISNNISGFLFRKSCRDFGFQKNPDQFKY